MRVRARAPQTMHLNWAEWNRYLRAYAAATKQIIVKETLSCELWNKRVLENKRAQLAVEQGKDVNLAPLEWKAFQRVFICTHGWPSKD